MTKITEQRTYVSTYLIQKLWRQFGLALFFAILMSAVWMAYSSFKDTLLKEAHTFDVRIEFAQNNAPDNLYQLMVFDGWQAQLDQRDPLFKTNQIKWARIQFTSQVSYDATASVVVNNPNIDLLDFYEVNATGTIERRRFIGDHRSMPWSSDYSMPLHRFSLEAFSEKTIYVRAQMSRLTAFPIQTFSKDQLEEYREFQLLFWGAFLGLTLIMILYYLSLYRAMRESIYLAYAIFTVVTIFYMSMLYGLGYHIIPLKAQAFAANYIGTVGLMLMLSILLFTRNFLMIESRKSDTHRDSLLPLGFSVLLVGSVFVNQRWIIILALALQPFLFIYLSVLIVRSFKRRQHWAQFYLLSWVPVFVAMPYTTLAAIGFIPSSVFARYAFFVSIIAQLALTAWSFSERMKMTEQRRIFQTTHDRYTALPNRSALIQTLHRWMNHHESYSLVFIEVGTFLRFLPYVGAERAALLIAAVAEIVREHWSENKEQWGEVESINFTPPYLVRDHVLAIIVNKDAAIPCMQKLHQLCDRDITIAGIEISVNPTLAAVNYPDHSRHADDLIQKSMQALDYAKTEALPYSMFLEERVQYSEQEVRIATDLRKAIQNNELQLFHQPQIHLDDFSIYGSEVLLRWFHDDLGFIPPDVFVKVAEDIGMIEDLTLWVVNRALAQQRKLMQAGYLHKLSINISGKDVNSENFFTNVSQLLSKHQVEGKYVTLELTESVTVKDKTNLKNLMDLFKDININFSIDDFGTGFSSLEALSELNFSELKIDRSFVQDMINSTRNYTIASATIELANRLELDTVAEGVENEKVIFMLKSCDCKIAQGYYFSKPLSFDDYLSWLGKT